MKNCVILVLFASGLFCAKISAQIRITSSLADSIISKTFPYDSARQTLNDILTVKFTSLQRHQNSIYVSATSILDKRDINGSMNMYIGKKNVFFLILNNVNVDSSFRSKLINYNDPRFNSILDSIRFGYGFGGLVMVRSPLEVYHVRKRLFCKNTYVITSKKYNPYLSAPEPFIPIKKFFNQGGLDEIDPWYYDDFGNLNEQYYEDLKPEKKIILKMPKEK